MRMGLGDMKFEFNFKYPFIFRKTASVFIKLYSNVRNNIMHKIYILHCILHRYFILHAVR